MIPRAAAILRNMLAIGCAIYLVGHMLAAVFANDENRTYGNACHMVRDPNYSGVSCRPLYKGMRPTEGEFYED